MSLLNEVHAPTHAVRSDALSTILRSVRLGSAILSVAELTAPWGVRTKGAPTAIFHAVVKGQCLFIPADEHGLPRSTDDSEPIALNQGDVLVVTQGVPHIMCSHPTVTPVLRETLAHDVTQSLVPLVRHGGGGLATHLICGTFRLEHQASDALLALLPSIMHIDATRDSQAHNSWIGSTLHLLDTELRSSNPGGETMVDRLADVLFTYVLRQHVLTSDARCRGWIAALHDGSIGRALALIHTDPKAVWNANTLAARVGMSRTRFFERFTELLGDPPARYLARSRVNAAIDLMRRQDMSIAELASQVGYGSEKAFTKVFKRYLGASPSEYRKRLRIPSA